MRKRAVFASALTVIVTIATAYIYSLWRLHDARRWRREDQYVQAEHAIRACIRLPGLIDSIDFEYQLLGVQQGDLREEQNWKARTVEPSIEGLLILEALAKGNLAIFQWEVSRRYADSILNRHPANSKALWLRGRAYVEMQQESKALVDFENAFQQEPGSFGIRHSLADLLHKLGFVRIALGHYQTLVNERPDDPVACIRLARCMQEEMRYDESRALLDCVLESQPELVDALIERSRLALREGDLSSAESLLRRVLDITQRHADANHLVKIVFQSQKKSDDVLLQQIEENERRQVELKNALRVSRPGPAALTEIGRWMTQTAERHEVLGWFYSALKEDPSYKPAHEGLAEFFYKNGQRKRAQWHAQQSGNEPSKYSHQPTLDSIARITKNSIPVTSLTASSEVNHEASEEEVHRLCTACHAYPTPESMPRSNWRKEIKQGYDFLHDSNLTGKFPAFESVVQYYERRAPEQFVAIKPTVENANAPFSFQPRGTGYVPNVPSGPGVTNANLASLSRRGSQELLLCETRLNAIMILRPYETSPGGVVIPEVASPCHSTVCDLDLDGQNDILVASIGEFFPTDDRVGTVLWLRGKRGGSFDSVPLLKNIGRVSDIQYADFNQDGKIDLIVSVFGWRRTGQILYLENQTLDWTEPRFITHVVDERNGAIHVPVADLNRDGVPDFLSLVSQHHETIAAYLNRGDGTFHRETVFTAPHPSYGSSGIEMADLDGDNDLDVLYTNGDVMDKPHLLKPYHGIQWLENEGTFPFTHRPIAAMHGVSRAVAADFDGDGDHDIAAVSFLPVSLFPDRDRLHLPSVAIFEQQSKMGFVMHTLESGTCDHYSCAAGDWDADGRIDLAVTNFISSGSPAVPDAATLWRNIGKKK